MNLLLDTHGFLWSLFTPGKLSEAVIREMKFPTNGVAVSVVTFWEISLKNALGKLELTGVKPEELPAFADQMSLRILPRVSHKDPFDRIIIWQAIQRRMALASKDRDFKAYREFGLRSLW